MEIGLFFLDIIAVIVLVVTGLRNDVKRPGEPLVGPFRYDVTPSPAIGGKARSATGRPDLNRR